MVSIIIPAHNEGSVIEACLDALLGDPYRSGAPEIVVAANGCTDDTVRRADSRPGVTVVDIAEAGKAAALNAAERTATAFPRIYLDADIVVPPGAVTAIADVLRADNGVLAAVPQRRVNVAGRPWPVRAYFAISQRLPAFESGLFGRGMIGLAEQGRQRFGEFPGLIADDLFLDSLFEAGEKAAVPGVEVVVETPWRTRDLVHRLVRVRRGNAAMRAAGRSGLVAARVRPADRWAWLRAVVLRRPTLAPAGLVYVALTGWAGLVARRTAGAGLRWERDESTRQSAAGAGGGR